MFVIVFILQKILFKTLNFDRTRFLHSQYNVFIFRKVFRVHHYF